MTLQEASDPILKQRRLTLLPYDPVQNKRNSASKRGAGDISDLSGAEIASFGSKEGIGKSGVHLRWHTTEEYGPLDNDQKEELREWRKTDPASIAYKKKNKGKKVQKKGGKTPYKRTKHENKAMAAAINKGVEKRLADMKKETAEAATPEEQRKHIMSLFEDKAKVVKAVTLQSILHKANNMRI